MPAPDPNIRMPAAPGEPARRTPFNINPMLPERLRAQLSALLEQWRTAAFAEDLSQLTEIKAAPFEIRLSSGTPISVPRRRLNPHHQEFVGKELAEMEKYGVIQRSTSPYGAPMVLVKQGAKLRLCIDYRQLNDVTVKRRQPMPLIGETLDAMAGANVFCVCDMFKGFWQQLIAEEDRHKTAFYGPDALWEFRRMPFGLANAPAAFQSFSSQLVQRLPGTECFVDDIISGKNEPSLPPGLSSASAEEINAMNTTTWTIDGLLAQLLQLLQAVVDASGRLNIQKCFFGYFKVDVLGFVLSDNGKAPQPQKVKAILELPAPRNLHDLRSFLGCCSFYREHIPHFANVTAPLNLMLKKDAKFIMGPQQLHAVETLKRALTEAPCLRLPDFSKEFFLYTDWSQEGIGAVLMQRSDGAQDSPEPAERGNAPPGSSQMPPGGGYYAVAYASRSNNSAERNLSAFEGEWLAAVWAVTKWDFYLSNARFTWFVDHQALTWLMKSRQQLVPKHARWALKMAGYDFECKHTPGALNVVADHLSRSFPGVEDTPPSDVIAGRNLTAATIQLVCAAVQHGQQGDAAAEAEAVSAIRDSRQFDSADIWLDTEVMAFLRDPQPAGSRRVAERAAAYRWQPFDPSAPVHDTTPSTGLALLHAAAQHHGGRLLQLSTRPHQLDREVPPPAARRPLCQLIHEFWNHQGRTRTFFRLQPRFWWHGIFQTVASVVADCQACDMSRARATAADNILQPLPIMGLFYRFNVDLAGPLPLSPRGNCYVMICVEHLTGFVVLAAIPRKTAQDTAAIFSTRLLSVFGSPAQVVTDQGNEWLGEFAALLVSWQIDHRSTARNHPQANGKAERTVETVKSAVRIATTAATLASAPDFDWDSDLPRLQLALNSSAQTSTGQSPYFLLFGRPLLYPSEIRQRFAQPLDDGDADAAGTEALVRASLLVTHTLTAMNNQAAAQARDTERYATVRTGEYIRRATLIQPGHLVYLVRKQQHSTDVPIRDLILVVVAVDGNVATMQGRCGRTIKDHVTNVRRCHLTNVNMAINPSLRTTTILQACERCLAYESPADNPMLVCDGCSTCWHCACCSPKLSSPPQGTWLCTYCVALHRQTTTTPPPPTS